MNGVSLCVSTVVGVSPHRTLVAIGCMVYKQKWTQRELVVTLGVRCALWYMSHN